MMTSLPSLEGQHHTFNLIIANQTGRCRRFTPDLVCSLVLASWYSLHVASTRPPREKLPSASQVFPDFVDMTP